MVTSAIDAAVNVLGLAIAVGSGANVDDRDSSWLASFRFETSEVRVRYKE